MTKENIVFVKRVSYGKEDTPEKDREYQIDGKGPVGTLQEYIDAGMSPVIEGKKLMVCPKCNSTSITIVDDSFDHDWAGGGTEVIRYPVCIDCGYGEKDGEDDWEDDWEDDYEDDYEDD